MCLPFGLKCWKGRLLMSQLGAGIAWDFVEPPSVLRRTCFVLCPTCIRGESVVSPSLTRFHGGVTMY